MTNPIGNPLKTEAAKSFGLLLLRIPLGATFLLYGYEKLFRLGVGNFVHDSAQWIPTYIPPYVGQTYLYALPFAEIAIGALLIAGLFARFSAFVAALMLVSFTIAVSGLFTGGDYLHVNPNVAYLGMALLLITAGAGTISLDRTVLKTKS